MKKSNPALQAQIQKCICYGVTALVVVICSMVLYFSIDRITGLRHFVRAIGGALMPVTVGVIIAYLLSPVYNFLHRTLHPRLKKLVSVKAADRWAKGLSVLFSLVFLLLVLYALLAMIIPQLIDSVVTLSKSVPAYIRQIRTWLNVLLEDYPELQTVVVNAFNAATIKAQEWASSHLDFETIFSDSLQDFLSNAWGVVTNISAGVKDLLVFLKNFVIGLIIAIYLLAAKQKMCGRAKRLIYTILPCRMANIVLENCRFAHRTMSGFISGKILDSMIIGVLCFAGCSILQIPYALLVSVIIGVTNIVPFFGPFIGAIPCALFILIISPYKCLVFVILILVLQQFDGNILGPKILGNSTGLSSFWVIFSLLLFGGLFGFAGMVLGCPIWAVICHIVDEITQYALRQKGLSTDVEDYELLGQIENGEYQRVPDPALQRVTPEQSADEKHAHGLLDRLWRHTPPTQEEPKEETED